MAALIFFFFLTWQVSFARAHRHSTASTVTDGALGDRDFWGKNVVCMKNLKPAGDCSALSYSASHLLLGKLVMC